MSESFAVGRSPGNGDVGRAVAIPIGLDVFDAAYHAAHGFGGGVPALAQRMGMSANTLQHKVSLTNTTHHLTLREAIGMQEITGNVSVLHAMAAALGYTCVSVGSGASATTLEQVMRMAQEFGEVLASVNTAVADGCVTPNEMLECERQAAELMAALNATLVVVRNMMPKRPEVA